MKQYTIDTPYQVGAVHCYLFEINGRHILIDTGPPTDAAKTYLKQNIPVDTLDYVFITHCHADHYGLVDYISEEFGATPVISQYDAVRFTKIESRISVMHQLFLDMGFTQEMTDCIATAVTRMDSGVPVTCDYLILEEQEELLKALDMSYVRCPGHSQSDIVYLLQGYAVSGDVVLKDIFQTPLLDIDYDQPSRRFHNYQAFCNTISTLKEIEPYHFLPGHRYDIGSIDERIVSYLQTLIKRSHRLKHRIQTSSIADIVLSLITDPIQHPIFTYLKTSEVLFIQDFIDSPTMLFSVLNKTGLYNILKDDINILFE